MSNSGPSDAAAVTVSDTIPANTSFVSATPSQGSCTGTATVTCTLGTIARAGTATITVNVQSNAGLATGTTISNTATVTSATADPNAANNGATGTTTIATGAVDLSIAKTAKAPPYGAGLPVTCTINVGNAGPSPANDVIVTDVLPAGATFVSATPSQGTGTGAKPP